MILLTLARKMIQDELEVIRQNVRGEHFDLQFVINHSRAMAQIAGDALEMSKNNESPIYMAGDMHDHDHLHVPAEAISCDQRQML